jgi:hypothetical protein
MFSLWFVANVISSLAPKNSNKIPILFWVWPHLKMESLCFLQNVDTYLWVYLASQPKTSPSSPPWEPQIPHSNKFGFLCSYFTYTKHFFIVMTHVSDFCWAISCWFFKKEMNSGPSHLAWCKNQFPALVIGIISTEARKCLCHEYVMGTYLQVL